MMIKLFVLTFILSVGVQISSFSQWVAQNSGVTVRLEAVQFITPDIGWAVGDSGTIITTVDGGSTWTPQTSGTTLDLNDLKFLNQSDGWVCGEDGAILITNDGGNTWSTQNSGTMEDFKGIDFYDANNGIAAGWGAFSTISIFKTSNGGVTWVEPPALSLSGLRDVLFLSASDAILVGGQIMLTTDTGNTWPTWYTLGVVSTSGRSVSFADASNGWLCGADGIIFNTETAGGGGQPWAAQNSGTTNDLNSIHMVNTSKGWSVGTLGTIVTTTNGGSTWSSETSGTSEDLYGIHFSEASNGWAVGDNGTIVYRYELVGVDNLGHIENGVEAQVYPNPNSGEFTIELTTESKEDLKLTITNMLGQEVFREELNQFSGLYKKSLEVSTLGKGVYLLQVETSAGVVGQNIVVE